MTRRRIHRLLAGTPQGGIPFAVAPRPHPYGKWHDTQRVKTFRVQVAGVGCALPLD